MTTVDLSQFCRSETEILDALLWMIENQGPIGAKRKPRDLRFINFECEKEATFFILRWG